ncbi:hypothetical protein [Micromonospora sp. NPDC049891]|uniref:hypothetical protein n=1 Tax=Micromonospora sp. NPDC049891 TaxID=3155655 RepID=UPI0033F16FCB
MATKKNITTPINESYAALNTARETLANRQALVESVTEAREELLARLDSGDESVTADDIAAADFGVRRAEGLVNAAKRDLDQAERAHRKVLADHDPTLAEFVAAEIQKNAWAWSLYGVPVNVGRPGKDAPTPSAWVYQDEPAKVGKLGELSGLVTLEVRTPSGAPYGHSALMHAIHELHPSANGNPSPGPTGGTVRLRLDGVKASHPVLPAGPLRGLAADMVLSDVVTEVTEAGPKVAKRFGVLGRRAHVPAISGNVRSAQEVDTKADGNFTRHTVEGVISFTRASDELIRQALADMVGYWSAKAGRVESVVVTSERVESNPNNPALDVKVLSVRVVVVSRNLLA